MLLNSDASSVYAYCAAFAGAQYTLQSINSVKAKGFSVFAATGRSAVNVTGLLPYTEYSVFCTALSLGGVDMDLSDVQRKRLVTSTLCCRRVMIDLTTTTAKEGTAIYNGIAMSVDTPPASQLQLLLSCPALRLGPLASIPP